jgi:hypothetical protein
MEENRMKSVRLLRPLLFAAMLAGLALGPIGQTQASNPIHGKWVAQVPGGGVSYYHFHNAVERNSTFDKGRFTHVYHDRGREVVLQGTYRLRHFGHRGKLHLHFDNGLRIDDIEHAGKDWLQLRHVGRGIELTYTRAH